MRLIEIGRAFHNRGPTTLNERSPKLTRFVRAVSKGVGATNVCGLWSIVSLACRQDTTVPCHRCFMGSQCSYLIIGVMRSRPGVKVGPNYPGNGVLYSLKCSSGSPARGEFA